MAWYVLVGNDTFGPYDSAKLKKLADAGRIGAMDGVSKNAKGPWYKAATVPGLFEPVAKAVPKPPQIAPARREPAPPPMLQTYAAAPAAPAVPVAAVVRPPMAPSVAAAPASYDDGTIPCRVCGRGSMQKRKRYRLSGPAVLIGWIFLVPSFLGMIFGVLMLFATGGAVSNASDSMKRGYERDLRAAGLSESQISKMVRGERLLPSERSALTTTQQRKVDLADLGQGAAALGTGVGATLTGGFGIAMIVMSFCGGLLGWLLTMKKRVLQCDACEAVVAAS